MSIDYYKRIFSAYFLRKRKSNLGFWHTPLAVNKISADDIKGVRHYPMNFIAKTDFKEYCDDDGVIMLNYYGDLGVQYNPNAIAQQALGYYDKYLDSADTVDKDAFLTQVSYFLGKGRTSRGGAYLWEYNFPFEMRNQLSKPWRSGLAQGQALSVLIRAYDITKDERYTEAAHAGYNAFRFLAREHEVGVLDDQNGFTWLEEYIVSPPNHVLNGFIWALWGVRDYAVYFNDDHANNLWHECIKTLKSNLKNYDLGFWTSYDWPQGRDDKQPVMPSSIYYQRLHTTQMLAMYNLTGETVFLDYYKKWDSYLKSNWKKAASQMWKAYFKLRYF